jgi:hypothetical protein
VASRGFSLRCCGKGGDGCFTNFFTQFTRFACHVVHCKICFVSKLIWPRKPVATGFVKIVNIDKTDRFFLQNLKNKFKQNPVNQNDKPIGFFDLSVGYRSVSNP